MTDNEIIKALECCARHQQRCDECPDRYELKLCGLALKSQALKLINRQKAEIEELEAEIDKQYEQAKADILGNMADGGTSCHWCIDQHRAKAVKEFAERLKVEMEDKKYKYVTETNYSKIVNLVIDACIGTTDNLVKEFTEEKT